MSDVPLHKIVPAPLWAAIVDDEYGDAVGTICMIQAFQLDGLRRMRVESDS